MQRTTKRWLLSPLTQWRAQRFTKQQGAGMDVQTAWVLVRLRRNPAEADYALSESALPVSADSGVRFDEWSTLPNSEIRRRGKWLARHGKSPFQLLEISSDFIVRAGIEVTDWGTPPDDLVRP